MILTTQNRLFLNQITRVRNESPTLILYMAACYNNYSGNEEISQFDPNLQLTNDIFYEKRSQIND